MKARELAKSAGVHIILKGAYSAIVTPAGKCFFNPTGNPGMATGGSGDVLTGVVLALLAQAMSRRRLPAWPRMCTDWREMLPARSRGQWG